MSQANYMNKKRRSAPSAAAGSQAQLMGYAPPPHMYYQWTPGHPSQSHAHPGAVFLPSDKKPWNDSDASDSSEFEPTKKKKKRKPLSNKDKDATKGKNRVGCPTLLEQEEKKKKLEFLKNLQQAPEGFDEVSFDDKFECKNCKIYVGRIALTDCGHALFCYSCVRKLRDNAEKLTQFCKCPVDGCFTLAKGWIELFNVST